MPYVGGPLRQFQPGSFLAAAFVKKAQLNLLGRFRIDRKVHTGTVPCGPERMRAAWQHPGLHSRFIRRKKTGTFISENGKNVQLNRANGDCDRGGPGNWRSNSAASGDRGSDDRSGGFELGRSSERGKIACQRFVRGSSRCQLVRFGKECCGRSASAEGADRCARK